MHAALKLQCAGFLQSLMDPGAVAACMAAGVGGLVHGLAVGGKRDTLHGEPVLVTGVVTALSDGEWSDTGPVHGGRRHLSAGNCAGILVAEGRMTLVLTSLRCDHSSRGLFHQLGIEPVQRRSGVVAKLGCGGTAGDVRADRRRTVCSWRTRRANTSADNVMASFSFKHRRSPLFPFEAHAELTVGP